MSLLACALWLAADSGETVVRSRSANDVDAARVEAASLWDGAGALALVPGVVVQREGGPLAPARPVLRGLSHARLDVQVLGLSLVDPAAGVVDLGLLPWGLGDAVVDVGAGTTGLGGALALRRPPPGLRVDVGVGDLSTARGRARLVQRTDDGGRIGFFVDAATTRGDFAFLADDTLGSGGVPGVRDNNDQRRLNAAAFAGIPVPVADSDVDVNAAAAVGLREGGVPGFVTAPLALRAQDALAAAGVHVVARTAAALVDVGVDGTASDRATVAPKEAPSRIVGQRVAVHARGALRPAAFVDLDGGVVLSRAALPGLVRRDEADIDLGLALRLPIAPGWDADIAARAALHAFLDDDEDRPAWLPRGRLRLRLSHDRWTGFVGLAHGARAPTLDERFAPRGFIDGNPDLRPESVDELEAGFAVAVPRRAVSRAPSCAPCADDAVRVRVVGHASRLNDAIAPVNKNAFEISPENTGPAERAGLEVGVTASPHVLLAIDVAGALLHSRILATGAPLPAAPPLLLTCAPRLGSAEAFVGAVVAARGPVSATLFGTLTSPGSVLVDATSRVPLGPGLALDMLVQNVFDVRDARDQNLLPLPGRLLFVSLQVRA